MKPSCYFVAAAMLVGMFALGWLAGTLPTGWIPQSKARRLRPAVGRRVSPI